MRNYLEIMGKPCDVLEAFLERKFYNYCMLVIVFVCRPIRKAYLLLFWRQRCAKQYGGTGEIISDNDFGVCLKDNRVETVEKGIQEALLDEKKCKQQAENLHERVKEEYSWGKTVDALLRHFNNQTRRMENM